MRRSSRACLIRSGCGACADLPTPARKEEVDATVAAAAVVYQDIRAIRGYGRGRGTEGGWLFLHGR